MTIGSQNFPQINAPFVGSDGLITAPWRQFLQSLWNRTGGASSGGVGAFAVTDDNASNHSYFPMWITTNTGTATGNVSSAKLKFNPSTGTFSSPIFEGNLTGTATTSTALQSPRSLAIGGTTGLYAAGVYFDGTENISLVLSGLLSLASGGTGSDLSLTGGTSKVLQQTTIGGVVTVAQLAASDLSNGTTGSGAVVLVTSPTLVTPALGTPTALVGTNITGTAAGLTAGAANAINSATTTVNTASATAPTNGQVLTATSGTAATWQNPAVSTYTENTWTPTDASGAALAFTSAVGHYTRIGRMVFAEFNITYPVTVNASNAIIGGLPFTVGTGVIGGFSPSLTQVDVTLQVNAGAVTASVYTKVGVAVTNATLSTKVINGVLIYNV